MANIKKLALGLLVAVLAFGFSAFKNVKSETKLAPFYYGLNEDGTEYRLISDGALPECETGPSSPCWVSYSSELPNETFPNLAPFPTGGTFSTNNGYVEP